MAASTRDTPPAARPVVIGLTGGVGVGKSLAASILADLGCAVFDADQDAKRALQLPEVLNTIVRWWGDELLNDEGAIDHAALARRIFASGDDRARLEALVHPIVKRHCAEFIRDAAARGVGAVVIDVPLLFEAGMDADCDAIIFIDAPRDQRARRVHEQRGWDSRELATREAAQLPLDHKRSRSTITIANDATPEVLRERIGRALPSILRS